ncbi:hypothetical protein RC083_03340 [Pseudoalteromonas haloplanktis]|uniref:Uncharacterized protein n=1 Tax=Pseudoalteromonas haloplanktis TaxID=228 RepID=A0ABU1B8I6_PSEHA|nr:hypothetical protein [Pseudoalteromonas haloplanktis]MDQ9090626.1 hypothetical protein [Pseudoalteromonas haloplanktis]
MSLLVSSDFTPPEHLQTTAFYLTPLNEHVAELDFAAVMSSVAQLKGLFRSQLDWPNADMTLAQNRASLTHHATEFNEKKAFAYAILDPNKTRCLGSVYIDSTADQELDSEVTFWLRNDSQELTMTLRLCILHWLGEQWPFKKVKLITTQYRACFSL